MIFLDTSGLWCLLDIRDQRHLEATARVDHDRDAVTHSYVLAEFVPLCHARGLDRAGTLAFASDILESPSIDLVWVDEPLHRGAITLLQSRRDKTYSLCDAVSFLVTRQRGVQDALTTDRHFTQEGFNRLLPS